MKASLKSSCVRLVFSFPVIRDRQDKMLAYHSTNQEDEFETLLKSIQDTLKSLQRTLYAFRDSQREWLLADLLNRPGPLWLAGLDLNHTDLSHVDLSRANLKKANLERANLESAQLTGARLVGAYLGHANLKSANLAEADLEDADLEGADFREAILEGANLKGVKNLEKAVLKNTIMPNGTVYDKDK